MNISRTIALRKYRTSPRNKRSQQRYAATLRGKETRRAVESRYAERNREKRNAKRAVAHAVRTGKLPPIKTRRCNRCGEQAHHYHHHSYDRDQRLNVEPLCKRCHRAHHDSTDFQSLEDLGLQRGWKRQTVVSHEHVPDRYGRAGYAGSIVLRLVCGHLKSIRGSVAVPTSALCKPCVQHSPTPEKRKR